MVRTIFILIFTLIILPVFAFYYDAPLNEQQAFILKNLFIGMLSLAFLTFIVGELTNNNSQVDKLWSIVPAFYVCYVAYASDWNQRAVLMAILVTVWALRLTYNFSRRGGYQLKFWGGDEDYRWEILRQSPTFKGKKWAWTLFNLFFISLYQMTLILLFCLPAVVVLQGDASLHTVDYVLAFVFISLVVIEFIADQQQWNYQTEKHKRLKNGDTLDAYYKKGFTHTGLWKISRHPNYMAEQSVWIIFYLFSVAATGRWLNWSMAGCLLLLILFKGSSDFSEKISAEKYPDYVQYQKQVDRFWPFWKLLFKKKNS